MLDIPLEIHDIPVTCINQAAITYHVPATLIISVLAVEGGRLGVAHRNKNGSYDYGPMQINSLWLPQLEAYGYTQHHLQYNACANVMAGAWILSQNIANARNLWHGIGGYHSYTPHLNQRYQAKVAGVYQLLEHYLKDQ